MRQSKSTEYLIRFLLILAGLSLRVPVYGAGLSTDVALTPPEGGTIVRTQWRYSELSGDPTGMGRKIKMSLQPITFVHGLTQNLTILGTLPVIYRRVEFDSGTVSDTGFGDISLLAKYRFYQSDKPGVTTRWAAFAGAEVPSYDDPFSSESFDPIIGTVWTHQQLDWWVDWDVMYKFNTAGGRGGDDEFRADVAASIRLLGAESEKTGPWGLYAIGEVNGRYLADGSTEVFISPGLQFITSHWILEAGVQLPVIQEMSSPRLESDYTVIISVRFVL